MEPELLPVQEKQIYTNYMRDAASKEVWLGNSVEEICQMYS